MTRMEITNEDDCSYIDTKRAKSMKANLKAATFKGIVTANGRATFTALHEFIHIKKLRIGYQILPRSYRHLQSQSRRVVTQTIIKQIERMLIRFLTRIGLLVPIYDHYNYTCGRDFRNLFKSILTGMNGFMERSLGGNGSVLPHKSLDSRLVP